MKIRSKDLRPLAAFYTFHPGTWGSMGGPVQYRHPSITVWTTYGEGRYSAFYLSLKGQQDRESITAEPRTHSYAWELELPIEKAGDALAGRFLAALRKQSLARYSRPIRILIRALKDAGIPRCIWREDSGGRRHIPRRYKAHADRFLAAFDLGVTP